MNKMIVLGDVTENRATVLRVADAPELCRETGRYRDSAGEVVSMPQDYAFSALDVAPGERVWVRKGSSSGKHQITGRA